MRRSVRTTRFGRIAIALSIGAGVASNVASADADGATVETSFALATECPRSFERLADGTCKLHTIYDQYDSLHDRGVGGLRTALPPRRDRFTPAQIDLGRLLFFDPALSGNGTISCASCHDPARGFSDGRARSIGAPGTEVGRSAPTLWNVAFLQRFFWDGRASSLEEQMQGPLFAEAEMGNTREHLLQRLDASPAYRVLFETAFGGASEAATSGPISLARVYTALAAFESTLISFGSRYDRYANGDPAALSAPEIEGLNVFRSFVARCAECHTPPLFTNQQIAVIGVPDPEGRPFDPGAAPVFGNPTWRGGFKAPTLRNIATTAPYMHAGQFRTLRDAAEFYTKGRGHAVPEGERLVLHWHIWNPELRDEELDRLVDFLNALTDETLIPETPARVPSGLPPIGRGATSDVAVKGTRE